jgi:hypothetical protein
MDMPVGGVVCVEGGDIGNGLSKLFFKLHHHFPCQIAHVKVAACIFLPGVGA